ncbi:hypothetical protein KJ632_05035 [Patescibacteria group bacterium]|nr:hypothetical protein [Patescibacteria group bacterium]
MKKPSVDFGEQYGEEFGRLPSKTQIAFHHLIENIKGKAEKLMGISFVRSVLERPLTKAFKEMDACIEETGMGTEEWGVLTKALYEKIRAVLEK